MHELVVRKQCPRFFYRNSYTDPGFIGLTQNASVSVRLVDSLDSQYINILPNQNKGCFECTGRLQTEASNFQIGTTYYLVGY